MAASPYTRLFPGFSTSINASVSPAGTYSYSWVRDGVAVPGSNSATLPVTVNALGSYAVVVTNGQGCSNTSALMVIGDSASRNLFIWPNPNDGQFTVSYHATSQTNPTHTITVYDSKGSYVFRGTYNIDSPYQRMEVDLRKLSSGVYHIALTDKTGKRLAEGSFVIQ